MAPESNKNSRPNRPLSANIIGWGAHVPETKITNKDLEAVVNTSDAWIQERTGIKERRVVQPKEDTASLGTIAALHALDVANITPDQLGLIIVATSTGKRMPATASIVQHEIGATNAGAFDLTAACSGFAYALAMARGSILAGDSEYALAVGAETMTRIVDWTDRNTCILFGDGAGAAVLQASNEPGGILAVDLGSDGSGGDLLSIDQFLKMEGRQVFEFGVTTLVESVRKVVQKAGLTLEDIDVVISHQANERIIKSGAKKLGMPLSKFPMTIEQYGNTSAASIPLTLVDAINKKQIRPGDRVVFVGFGGGLSWASCVVEWNTPTSQPERTVWQQARRIGQQVSREIGKEVRKRRRHLGV